MATATNAAISFIFLLPGTSFHSETRIPAALKRLLLFAYINRSEEDLFGNFSGSDIESFCTRRGKEKEPRLPVSLQNKETLDTVAFIDSPVNRLRRYKRNTSPNPDAFHRYRPESAEKPNRDTGSGHSSPGRSQALGVPRAKVPDVKRRIVLDRRRKKGE